MRKAQIIGILLVAVLLFLGACASPPAPPPAEFEVVSLYIIPPEVTAGETVSITAVVKNIGGSEGTYAVILTADGVTIGTEEVAITPGSSKVVTFSLVKDAPGTYKIAIGELSSSLTVKEKVVAPPTPEEVVAPPCKKPQSEIGDWQLTYEVKITKGSNMAEVTIYLDDPNDELRWLYLRTRPFGPFRVPENYITNLRSEGGTVSIDRDKWEVEGVREAKLLYTVSLNVEYRGGGYSGFASSDWVITAGDFLFIIAGSRGPFSAPRVNVRLDIPSGWDIYIPYPETEPTTYDATGIISHHNPRDFIVMGNPDSFEVATREIAGTKFTAVVVEPTTISAQEVVEFISKVAVEYAEIAICIPPYILSVVAPEPMRRYGGEGKEMSIFVSDNNPFPFDLSWGSSTYAHELFHLYQKYYAGETWIKEGVATFYQFYGPLKAGYMTTEEFWNATVEVQAGRANKSAVLSQGRDPYFKGALITLALDIKIREDTDGKSSFDDVLQILNTDFHRKYVSSSVLKLIISSLTGNDYSDFFEKYVHGSEYPEEIFAANQDSYITFLTQELE